MPTPHQPIPNARLRTILRRLTTAALAVTCVILAVLLWEARREIRQAPPWFSIVLSPADSPAIRGGAGAESGPPRDRQVFRPPPGHRVVLTLELPRRVRDASGTAAGAEVVRGGVSWAAEVLPPPGEGPGSVQPVASVLRGAVQVEMDADPTPGRYLVNLYRFEGERPERVAGYGFRIGLPELAPAQE